MRRLVDEAGHRRREAALVAGDQPVSGWPGGVADGVGVPSRLLIEPVAEDRGSLTSVRTPRCSSACSKSSADSCGWMSWKCSRACWRSCRPSSDRSAKPGSNSLSRLDSQRSVVRAWTRTADDTARRKPPQSPLQLACSPSRPWGFGYDRLHNLLIRGLRAWFNRQRGTKGIRRTRLHLVGC
jgi:hypothetical protein